jgi:hypothetical protein
MLYLTLFKALLLAIAVTSTSAQAKEGLTSSVRMVRPGGELEVKLPVPSYGAELWPAARRHASNLTDLVAMQRDANPGCATQPTLEGSKESDGCEEMVVQRLCESMAVVRLLMCSSEVSSCISF